MANTVVAVDNPAIVLEEAGGYLTADPVGNHLIIRLLTGRVAVPEPGQYWLALDSGRPFGVAFQSPLHFPVVLSVMNDGVARAVAEGIAASDQEVPAVTGQAGSAAAFAGTWSEQRLVAANPRSALRLYEVENVTDPQERDGRARLATVSERAALIGWLEQMRDEIRSRELNPEATVDAGLKANSLWVWERRGVAVSVCKHSPAVAGVRSVNAVFTPAGARGRGFASGLVATVSQMIRRDGHRCVLFADLANPVANRIYRRLGYRAVAECLRYDFSPAQ